MERAYLVLAPLDGKLVKTAPAVRTIALVRSVESARRRELGARGVEVVEMGEEGLRGESFAAILERYPTVDRGLLGFIFVALPKDLKRRENLDFDPWERHADILGPMQRGEIVAGKDVALELAKSIAQGGALDLARFRAVDLGQVEADIAQLVRANPGKNQGVLMGMAMQKWRGKVDGKVVAQLVQKYVR